MIKEVNLVTFMAYVLNSGENNTHILQRRKELLDIFENQKEIAFQSSKTAQLSK